MRIADIAHYRAASVFMLMLTVSCQLTARAGMGVMTHFAHGWDPRMIALLQVDGIAHVRDELYWSEIEKSRGTFAFPPRYREYMAALAQAGIALLVPLTFGNPLYDEGKTPYSQAAIDAYARYAVAVLDEFGSQIQAVEIWNEFNGSFCDGPAAVERAGSYSRLLTGAAAAIRQRHPAMIIVGGVTAGVPLPYLERLFAGGALAQMDAVSVHPYRCDQPPEGIETEIHRLGALIEKYAAGKSRPIWVTEVGWGCKESVAPGDRKISQLDQADYLVRAFALLRSAGVENIYWYLFRDYDQFATMGLRHQDPGFTPKPALEAFRIVNQRLDRARFLAREASRSDVYSLQFSDQSGVFRVLWALNPTPLVLGEHATAANISGHAITSRRVCLTGSPIFVRGTILGLPAAESRRELLAESRRDFSLTQHASGWSYGYQTATSPFQAATEPRTTDWSSEWRTNAAPGLCLTAEGQHPSSKGTESVEAVRRWTSNFEGRAYIHGRIRCGVQGDGVTARVSIDSKAVYSERLGGGKAIEGRFALTADLTKGTIVAIAIGPGEVGDINFDFTQVEVTVVASQTP